MPGMLLAENEGFNARCLTTVRVKIGILGRETTLRPTYIIREICLNFINIDEDYVKYLQKLTNKYQIFIIVGEQIISFGYL